jgi:hypothetical protein
MYNFNADQYWNEYFNTVAVVLNMAGDRVKLRQKKLPVCLRT